MGKDKFKERAYKMLYENYKSILNGLIQKSYSLENRDSHGGNLMKEDRSEYIEKKVKAFEDLSKLEGWSRNEIAHKEELIVIETLEKCLGERELGAK